MSYSHLIDPVYRILKTNKSKDADQQDQSGERLDENFDEDKDEPGMEIVGKSVFKRGRFKV
jgi:hypothetical protein